MPRPAALPATALRAAYAAGELSPVEVVRDVLDVVAQHEPHLRALWARDDAATRYAAQRSAVRWRAGAPMGPVDGIPLTVKENLARVGVPMPAGTAGITPVVQTRNSPVVDRIEESGGIIIGSTVMPDWGMMSSGVSSLHGVTRSPWDQRLTTGGSSAGAGAAAAAGYGPVHVGTDIGGSIRLPGTWLGLTTLKPSAGRVPIDAPYLGRVAGPMARNAADAALLLSVIARADARDWTALPLCELDRLDLSDLSVDVAGMRVGLHLDAGCGLPVDPRVRVAVERAALVFSGAGAAVEPLAPFLTRGSLGDLDEFWRARSLMDFDALPPDGQGRVHPYIRRWVEAARGVTGERLLRDYTSMMTMQRATIQATEAFDVVLSPVAPMIAFPAQWPMPWGDADEAMAHIGFTVPFNMSGQPAAAVNCGFTADGRTIGLQVSGRRFDDAGVLRVVDWYEKHRDPDLEPRWPIPRWAIP